jgi:hypothetical protein
MIVRLSDEDSGFLEFYAVSCLTIVRSSAEDSEFLEFYAVSPGKS